MIAHVYSNFGVIDTIISKLEMLKSNENVRNEMSKVVVVGQLHWLVVWYKEWCKFLIRLKM